MLGNYAVISKDTIVPYVYHLLYAVMKMTLFLEANNLHQT